MSLHLSGPAAAGDTQPLAAINTTPLVDVMLVLLIIFLITVPAMRAPAPGRVALPRQAAAPCRARAGDVTLSVTRDGRLYWNDTALSGLPALRRRLAALGGDGARTRVLIRADRAAELAAVNPVIAACAADGITTLGFTSRAPRR